MRISDWSSDVCSSDLVEFALAELAQERARLPFGDLNFYVRISRPTGSQRLVRTTAGERRQDTDAKSYGKASPGSAGTVCRELAAIQPAAGRRARGAPRCRTAGRRRWTGKPTNTHT